jgi:hypothetical protein
MDDFAQIVKGLQRKGMIGGMAIEPDDPHEHEYGAGEGVDKEFEGRLYPFLAAPERTEEIDRHEGQLPEKVEKQGVQGNEDSHQAGLRQQHEGVEIGAAHRRGAGRSGRD